LHTTERKVNRKAEELRFIGTRKYCRNYFTGVGGPLVIFEHEDEVYLLGTVVRHLFKNNLICMLVWIASTLLFIDLGPFNSKNYYTASTPRRVKVAR
jgi:hypothetical protein